MALLGTLLVIAQMALLSFNAATTIVLSVGFCAAICWAIHATKQRDKWLFITNATVGCFALFGLL